MLPTKADLLIDALNGLIIAKDEIERLLEVIEEIELFKEPTDNIIVEEINEIIEKIEEELNGV